MRIKAASQALGVPIPTLRRWTQEFAGGLSTDARASEGRPRQFSARDMRVLRRAKELLAGEDVTYERARRLLAGEGLLQAESADGSGEAGAETGRDPEAEREAAERFVLAVVADAIKPVRDTHAALLARIAELERQVRALTEEARSEAAAAARAAEGGDGERRRSWPFR